jgi:hypothetical protein
MHKFADSILQLFLRATVSAPQLLCSTPCTVTACSAMSWWLGNPCERLRVGGDAALANRRARWPSGACSCPRWWATHLLCALEGAVLFGGVAGPAGR